MFKTFKKLFKRFIDYRIVGEYYETDNRGHKQKKYIKKYYVKHK